MLTTLHIRRLSISSLLILASASAATALTVNVSTFATAPVGSSQPDSVTIGDGSVWIEYGNGADSTGLSGSSTIVRYSASGAVQATFSIAGEVDGLKVNPVTGMVWALQNQDGNATLSLINPMTNTVSLALSYASPYVYGPKSLRGYDDVAFLDGAVYLSYTNPVNPGDPVLQKLNQGNNPSGPLTTTDILTAVATGQPVPDIDSLKSTWFGDLVLTSEGDGPGSGNPAGEYTLISHPGALNQTVKNVAVTDASGDNASGLDDVVFPSRSAGTLYVADTGANTIYALRLTGLDPNTPIVAIGDLNGVDEVATVNPGNGVVEQTLFVGVSVHGMEFVAAPEPSTWAMMLFGFAGLGYAGYRAPVKRAAAAG